MSNSDPIQLCAQYIQGGDLDRAEHTVRHLLRDEPDHLQGLCLLGFLRQARGHLEEALTLFKEASRANPDSAVPYNHMGGLFIQARQPNQAIVCLEEALRLSPFFPDAYNNLGKAHLLQKGEADALGCFQEAVRLRPDFLEALNNLALMHIGRREFDQARPLLERVVQAAPAYPGALVSLSVLHFEKGELEQALTLAQQALQLNPHQPAVRDQIGVVLLKLGRAEEAVPHFQATLQAAPDYRPALEHLGLALIALQRPDEAIVHLRQAVQRDPGDSRTLGNLVTLLMGMKRWAEVVQVASQVLPHQPNAAELMHKLALAHLNLQQAGQAAAVLGQVLKLRPEYPEALCSLGWAYTDLGQLDRAATVLREALRLNPNFAEAYNNLGLVHNQAGRPEDSRAAYEQAVRIRPDFPEALGGLANVCKDLGLLDEAISSYRRSIAANPHQPTTHSNLLLSLHYPPNVTPEEIFQEHLAWAKNNAASAVPLAPHPNDRDPERRLRIGYVSADFRGHVMGWYLEPVLESHDRERFEIFCYASVGHPDDATQRMQRLANHWRDIRNVSDEEVEKMIRRDRIDLLLDMSGHTGGNRLSIFTRKPAPVQASHFGYMDTSGLATMDYRITDAVCDPPGMTERYHTERLVRLPEILWCYRPNLDLEVNALPAASAGHLTLGMLNAFPKITPPAITAWAQVLKRLPQARLVLLAGVSPQADQRLRDAFADHGIDPGRLILEGKRNRLDYFRLFHGVDLLLDSFPYSGCNTTCDSLWMGVPVVTLAGQTCMARQGASPLAHLGLHDLIAATVEEYVETSVRLAGDLPRLTQLRATLRERMSQSTLMNPVRFTRQLEDVYRWMWRQASGVA